MRSRAPRSRTASRARRDRASRGAATPLPDSTSWTVVAASPARKRGTVLCLSVLVTALACACRAPAPDEPVVRRLRADGQGRPCTLAADRRPAAPVPATATLHFAPEDRGRRAAYAVWAWPIEPSRIDLGQVRSHRGVRLALGFGIQEAAWDAGGPPVDFVLVAKPRGRGPKRI